MTEFWVHALLIGGDVLATAIVGWGIVWEAPEQPQHRHRIASRLVICGIVFEALCSIALFGYDESISQEQQSKIIALESRLAARSLSGPQISDIARRVKSFANQEFAVVTYPNNPEAEHIAEQLHDVLVKAGWINKPYGGILLGVQTGVATLFDKRTPKIEQAARALVDALNENGIASVSDGVSPPINEAVNPRMTIEIGIKP